MQFTVKIDFNIYNNTTRNGISSWKAIQASSVHYKRCMDPEPVGIECIWTEIILRNKHILFGVFYRPPNSSIMYHSTIEDSVHLAIDRGISDIVITGDLNYNVLSDQPTRKKSSLCQQFSLHQCISEWTHYTANSSSLIDILLVSNKNSIICGGVGNPFLSQNTRYHCPVFGILNFSKPKRKAFNFVTFGFMNKATMIY